MAGHLTGPPPRGRNLVLTRREARELVALIRDDNGDADEQTLSRIADRLRSPARTATGAERAWAAITNIVVELDDTDTEALLDLIDHDRPDPALDRVANGIAAALTRRRKPRNGPATGRSHPNRPQP